MKIVLPEKVKFIIETLETHGYEAYAVGGCVRDTMLPVSYTHLTLPTILLV